MSATIKRAHSASACQNAPLGFKGQRYDALGLFWRKWLASKLVASWRSWPLAAASPLV